MKNSIPWWFKIIAKSIFSHAPLVYKFWQRIGLFSHGAMDQAFVINIGDVRWWQYLLIKR